MVGFELEDSVRDMMAQHGFAVHAAVSALAARNAGTEPATRGIGKYEGGVIVGRREICIRRNSAQDDYSRSRDETAEEKAVVEAIMQVSEILTRSGPEGLDEFQPLKGGDPLRSMLELDWNGNPKIRFSKENIGALNA